MFEYSLYELACAKLTTSSARTRQAAHAEYFAGVEEATRAARAATAERRLALDEEEAEATRSASAALGEKKDKDLAMVNTEIEAGLTVIAPRGGFTYACSKCDLFYRAFTNCDVEGCAGDLDCHKCRHHTQAPTQCPVCQVKRCSKHHRDHNEACQATVQNKCGHADLGEVISLSAPGSEKLRHVVDEGVAIYRRADHEERGCGRHLYNAI